MKSKSYDSDDDEGGGPCPCGNCSDYEYDSCEEAMARYEFVTPSKAESSPTESIRFMAAGYRFWIFSLEPADKKTAFLKNLATPELLELNNLVKGVLDLIWLMWGSKPKHGQDLEPAYVSSILSTGPNNILRLWEISRNGDPDEFEEFDDAGYLSTTSFFATHYKKIIASRKLDKVRSLRRVHTLEPMFDGDNAKMHQLLDKFEATKEAKKAAKTAATV
ncbi:hypothetical protein K438DRAFT_1765925 [Mycena galopus ATCC 62051]|nr:hypothetical protein K438DRAFT_1765925 [Mycena galopus ATCC 62051]